MIRRALLGDGRALTRLAHAAKRHWIRLWRDSLTVAPMFIGRHPVWCAARGARALGFYALSGVGAAREFEHLWVAPSHIGRGMGALMFSHAVATLRADGARRLRIASDPHAEGFYLRMGAPRVGEWPSTPRGRAFAAAGVGRRARERQAYLM